MLKFCAFHRINYTKSFKFNKVVSSFMILLKQNKGKKLNKKTNDKLNNLLEIYIPNIKKAREEKNVIMELKNEPSTNTGT